MQNEAKKLILERGNYVPVPRVVVTDKRITSEAKVLWMWLLTLPNGHMPGRNEAAESLGLNRKVITRAVSELQRLGLLTVKNGSRGSIGMALLLPSDWSQSGPVEQTDWSQKSSVTGADLATDWGQSGPSLININNNNTLSSTGVDKLAEVAEFWNATVEHPKVKELSESRRAKLRKRMKEDSFASNWRSIISEIATNRFLSGKKTQWRATFDWLIENDRNYMKVLEGHYAGDSVALVQELKWV